MTDLPHGWDVSTIGEVAGTVRGVTYGKQQIVSEDSEGAIPLLRATNIEPGRLDYFDPVWLPQEIVKSEQLLQSGDVLVATSSGSVSVVGKSALVRHERTATFGAFCTVLRPHLVLPEFLGYFVQSPMVRDRWSDLARGTNINNLKAKDLANTKLPLPTLDEQRRIVEILDDHFSRLDSALTALSAVDRNLSRIRTAWSRDRIGGASRQSDIWVERPIGECVIDLTQGKSPQCLSRSASDDEWGVLKTTAIQDLTFHPEHNKLLPPNISPNQDLEVSAGDIVITCAGPRNRCGVASLVPAVRQRLLLSGKMYKFRANTDVISPEYLALFLMSPLGQSRLDAIKTGTSESGMNMTQARFKSMLVLLPSLSEQQVIAEEHARLLDAQRRTLLISATLRGQLQSMRRSLLHAAFSGQLTKEFRND